MKLPIEFNDVIKVSNKVDEDGHLEIDLLFDGECKCKYVYMNKEQASVLVDHLKKVFKL